VRALSSELLFAADLHASVYVKPFHRELQLPALLHRLCLKTVDEQHS
jgi:hypothetical protein